MGELFPSFPEHQQGFFATHCKQAVHKSIKHHTDPNRTVWTIHNSKKNTHINRELKNQTHREGLFNHLYKSNARSSIHNPLPSTKTQTNEPTTITAEQRLSAAVNPIALDNPSNQTLSLIVIGPSLSGFGSLLQWPF